MSNDKRTVIFFLISIFADIGLLIVFGVGTISLFFQDIVEGKDLFSANYWIDYINLLNPIRFLGVVGGFCASLYYLFKRLPVHYKLPFLTVFTAQNIYLYSIFGSRKIKWNNIALFEARRIENTIGREDGMLIKIVEVKLTLKSMEEVKFQLDTYSEKKLDMIYQLKDSAKN
jgi:hypothetical protein